MHKLRGKSKKQSREKKSQLKKLEKHLLKRKRQKNSVKKKKKLNSPRQFLSPKAPLCIQWVFQQLLISLREEITHRCSLLLSNSNISTNKWQCISRCICSIKQCFSTNSLPCSSSRCKHKQTEKVHKVQRQMRLLSMQWQWDRIHMAQFQQQLVFQ